MFFCIYFTTNLIPPLNYQRGTIKFNDADFQESFFDKFQRFYADDG